MDESQLNDRNAVGLAPELYIGTSPIASIRGLHPAFPDGFPIFMNWAIILTRSC